MTSQSVRSIPAQAISLTAVAGPVAVGLLSVAALAYAGVREIDAVVVVAAAAAAVIVLFLLALRRAPVAKHAPADAVTGLATRSELVAELHRRLTDTGPAPILLLILDLHGFKEYNDDFGYEAGDALLARLARKLAVVAQPDGEVFRLEGDEFCLVAPVREGDAERLIAEASSALSEHGEGFRIGSSFGGVLVPYETADPEEALRLAGERLSGQRRSKQRIRTVNALADALAVRRESAPLTGRLESLAVAVGGLLGVHGDRIEALARAAELHDVGRDSIPEEILDKPGPLDADEWEFVRSHPVIGEHVLRSSPHLWGVASIVRATYENWDGTGYPDRLVGEDIPFAARIIRVCHAFDAMMSPRPYRPALTSEEALTELESRSGTTFDPAVVRVLCSLIRARLEGERAA